jgi:hypothetical protein
VRAKSVVHLPEAECNDIYIYLGKEECLQISVDNSKLHKAIVTLLIYHLSSTVGLQAKMAQQGSVKEQATPHSLHSPTADHNSPPQAIEETVGTSPSRQSIENTKGTALTPQHTPHAVYAPRTPDTARPTSPTPTSTETPPNEDEPEEARGNPRNRHRRTKKLVAVIHLVIFVVIAQIIWKALGWTWW